MTRGAAVLALALPLLGVAIPNGTPLGRGAAVQPAPHAWRWRVARAIEAGLAAPQVPDAGFSVAERAELVSLYTPGRNGAIWTDDTGSLTADARAALALLASASLDGLDEDDYALATLQRRAAALDPRAPPDPEPIASLDLRLSAAVLRYFRHLHLGRVDPRTVGIDLAVAHDRHDFVAPLRAALAAHDLRATAAGLAPAMPQYAALRRQLARYRALGDVTGAILPPLAAAVHPGERYAGAESLRRRLAAFGDLPADAGADRGDVYDPELAAGVRRFQLRHGITADGVFGRATLARVSVPVGTRIRQIELAMERLRWLADVGGERLIVLNIPMFRLAGWEPSSPAGPVLSMRAIVGRALRTETPVFTAEVRSVIFRPYWNVPRSILLAELLPLIRRDPASLGRLHLEIVDGDGDGAPVVEATEENLARLHAGELRIRQRPGPGNALGLVKFDMPNDAGVYLHGTPAVELFERARRDFSHGCIRVEDPAALATWVLRDEPGWDRARIEAAMAAAASSRVALTGRMRVVLFYTTAAVVAADGLLHFAEDIYHLDARLEARLRARSRAS